MPEAGVLVLLRPLDPAHPARVGLGWRVGRVRVGIVLHRAHVLTSSRVTKLGVTHCTDLGHGVQQQLRRAVGLEPGGQLGAVLAAQVTQALSNTLSCRYLHLFY